MKPFIRIGKLYLNVSDIIAVEPATAERTTFADGEVGCDYVPVLRVTTRVLKPFSWSEEVGAEAICRDYDFDSDSQEADALLSWLKDQSEVLL